MEKITEPSQSIEFAVNVENINFRLLVDRQPEKDKDQTDTYILHSHVSAELFACLSGEVTIATEKGDLRLFDGDIAVVPPGVPHCMLRTDGNTESRVISFICNKRSDRSAQDIYSILSPFVCSEHIAVYRERGDECECVAETVRLGQRATGILPALRALELLIGMAEDHGKEDSDTADAKGAEGRYDIQRMMRLDAVVGSSYMKDLTLREIADELYISSRQLDRIVRRRYGKTLHKVIMDTRVRAAEQMLLTTDMTVERIGRAVGFSSGAGFYREFVRAYGVTPAEYRKKATESVMPRRR